MKRRELIQNITGLTGLGIIGGFAGPTMSIASPMADQLKDDWHNAMYKGIHFLKGGYEKNLTRVRC